MASWIRPSIFNWLQELGNIDEEEMLKTLNCGIGMILVINQKDITKISKILEKKNDFGENFISLARDVYITNDIRFDIKNKINDFFGSSYKEEKSYEEYK